jgi:CRISPR type IV-associated protein Csf1
MERLYPSQFVLSAIKMQPVGSIDAPFDTECALCSMPIKKGDTCTHEKNTTFSEDSFVDNNSAAKPGNEYICNCCVPLWTKEFLQSYSKSLVTKSGMYKLASNEEWASLLISPPKEPFMAFLSNAQQQHLIWRTPINYSTERFVIRVGANLFPIRHKKMMRGVLAQKRLLKIYQDWYVKTKKGKPSSMLTIFVGGDREIKSCGFLTNPQVVKAAEEINETVEMGIINELSQAERWAVAVIGWSKLEAAKPLINRFK